MAIDFPDSPSGGDRYLDWTYDSSRQTWRRNTYFAEGEPPVFFYPLATGSVRSDGDTANSTPTVGDYKYHVFQGSGTFTVTRPGVFEALIVAGGGGGGNRDGTGDAGGGGGAGGVYMLSKCI